MAIRRPPTTFSDSITGADLASDIAISTTGNIATTGSGTLTSAGAFTASGGIANAGTITAGTLGSSVVFPTKVTDRTEWYQLLQSNADPSSYGTYSATANVQSSSASISGSAPTGFTSVVSAYVWFIAANAGTVTYSATLEWQIGSSSNDYNQHVLSPTALYSQSSAQHKIWRKSIIGIGTDGQRFENLIASDDVFGINIDPTTAEQIRMLGIEITWRF